MANFSQLSAHEVVVACLQSADEPAWAEFIRRFQPLIASVVIRVAGRWDERSPQAVDDLIQETYLKLCSERATLIQRFQTSDEHSVFGFIKVFTANLVHDHFKASRASKRGGQISMEWIDEEMSQVRDKGRSAAAEAFERQRLVQQVADCLAATVTGAQSERDSRIFWLYYRIGLSATEIAALPTLDLTTKGVESTILRLTRLVRQQLGSRIRLAAPSSKGMSSAESS